MAITSQLRSTASLGEVWLSGWEMAGLIKPSAIKPVIATLEQSLVIRKLGALVNEDRAELKRAIGDILITTQR